jgi:amino acid transporter
MSEAASVPFSETKAPESPDRLNRGALGLIDISASTMANIGPAYSFYFSAGFLFLTAEIAAPLTIIVAGIAIALLGNTLSQFSRVHPSTGGFISYVGKTFGGTSAVTTALLCGAGYIIAISSVLAICGGYLSLLLQYYFNVDIPWGIFSVVFTAGAIVMMVRGVAVSTKLAGLFFGFEMLVLVVVSVAALIKNGGHLSAVPFEPSHLAGGFSGLSAGFPLAVYLFIGWENSAALAEETNNPRRNVPRAIYMSVALMLVGYVLYAYATATGFKYNITLLNSVSIPFIAVSHNVAAWLAVFAWIAGLTSTLGVLISAVNSQARLIFNAIAAVIIVVWALLHLAGGSKQSGQMNALNFFVDSSTMGTILLLVVYFLSNLALPFYYRRYQPGEFNVLKHAVLPVLGMIAVGVPVYYLVKPGQPSPLNWFPYAALGVIVVSVIYAFAMSRRDPGLGDRVGSIIADE